MGKTLRELGDTIYGVFVMPGELVLSALGIISNDQSLVMLIIVSLTTWFLIAVAGLMILKLGQNMARIVGALIRTVIYQVSLAIGNVKTKLVLKLRELLPRKVSRNIETIPMVEFDDLDFAVLRSAAARGPGFTTSAPEIADEIPLRPAQIQRSLDKLRKNKVLEYVIGSTDGFDNYRLSQMGTAIVASWQRGSVEP